MKIAICDDEAKYRKTIADFLKPYEETHLIVVEEFQSAEMLLETAKRRETFDIVFMDIEMSGLNGVDAAKTLKKLNEDIIIIFVTAYIKYISETFRMGAFQFLLKPINEEDLKTDFERAVQLFGQKHRKYQIRTRENTLVFEYKDIYCIETVARRLILHTKEEKYGYTGKLSDVYEELKEYGFSRIHQGYIVNLDKITKIAGFEVWLDNGTRLPISRNLKKNLLQELNRFIR